MHMFKSAAILLALAQYCTSSPVLTARASTSICGEPANEGDIYDQDGPSQVVSGTLTCSGETDCSVNIMKTIIVDRALTDESNDIVIVNGDQATVTASVNILADGTSNAALSKAITDSFAETGTSDISLTVSQTYQQVSGTTGVIYFTPLMSCQNKLIMCGDANGTELMLEQCFPTVDENGNAQGTLNIMTTE